MNITSALGAVLLFALSGYVLAEFGWRGAPLFSLFCFLATFPLWFPALSSVAAFAERVGEVGQIGEIVRTVLKILCVAGLCSLVCDTCRDLGQTRLEVTAYTVGKIEILVLIFPYLEKILEEGTALVLL